MIKWRKLEEKIKSYLSKDNAVTVPGSGNGKGEEDVIGLSTICQCKSTEKKNISILAKDIERLLKAAQLQKKFPLFVSESNKNLVFSFIDNNYTKDILNFIIALSLSDAIERALGKCNSHKELQRIDKLYTSNLRTILKELSQKLRDTQSSIPNKITAKYTDLLQTNLFEKGD